MKKKWWIFVSLVIGIFVVLLGIGLVGDGGVRKILGGVIITAPSFPGSSGASESLEPEGEDSSDFQVEPDLAPETETYGCWQCPEDEEVVDLWALEVSLEDLTDGIVSILTECAGVTQLISVPCDDLDQVEIVCGNGICEDGESAESCPGDCGPAPVETPVEESSDAEEIAEVESDGSEDESNFGEEEPEEAVPSGIEAAEGDFHYEISQGGQCVRINKEGLNKCTPGDEGYIAQSPKTMALREGYPQSLSLFKGIFSKMFGMSGS